MSDDPVLLYFVERVRKLEREAEAMTVELAEYRAKKFTPYADAVRSRITPGAVNFTQTAVKAFADKPKWTDVT